MADGDNPYQAPESKPDQFLVEWRRPLVYTVAGSLCWFFAATLTLGICYCIPTLIKISADPGWENFLATKFGQELSIRSIGCVILIPCVALAGQSFWKGRGRRGLIICFVLFVGAQLFVSLTGIK